MTEQNQKQLGRTLWSIADDLRGSMNADDFRDYMLAFLFLRYLSDNYEAAAKKELLDTLQAGFKDLFTWYNDLQERAGTGRPKYTLLSYQHLEAS
jgi:type I restriction-modification system DNA methylase subunit